MYFMDFAKKPTVTPTGRYFLSGDNGFLKSYVIQSLAQLTDRTITRVASVKELMPDEGLFAERRLYVLGSKSNPKKFQDFTVKISSSSMGKTYKEAGFTEIICSNMFPNQVKQFGVLLASQFGVKKEYAGILSATMRGDPYSMYNAMWVLSYVQPDLDKNLPFTLDYITNYLGTPDTYQIIDLFMEGNYDSFIYQIRATRINIHELLWSLLGVVLRLQKAYNEATFAVSWYQKKLLAAAEKLAPYRFDKLLIYINQMCTSYGESKEVLMLRLQRLIFYLRGLTPVL